MKTENYYFYDTDKTGTVEYDLSGDAYHELLAVCGKYCTTVSFLDRTRSKKMGCNRSVPHSDP